MEIQYSFQSKNFAECTHGWSLSTGGNAIQPGTRLKFQNIKRLSIDPTSGTPILLGLHIIKHCGFPLILNAICENQLITCHTGLIDPGYQAEVAVIVATSSQEPEIIEPGQLTVFAIPVGYTVPVIKDDAILKNPVYDQDAGFDFRTSENICLLPKTKHTFSFDLSHLTNIAPGFTPVVLGRSGIACRGILVTPTKINIQEKFTIIVHNLTKEAILLAPGTRIAQLIFVSKANTPSILQIFTKHINECDIPENPAIKFKRVHQPLECATPSANSHDSKQGIKEIPLASSFSEKVELGGANRGKPCRGKNGFGSSGYE